MQNNWQLFCILCKNRWPVVSGWFLFSLGHSFHFFHMIFNEAVVCIVDAFSSFILVSAHTLMFYGINWLAIISASTFDFRFKHVHTWGPFSIIFFSLLYFIPTVYTDQTNVSYTDIVTLTHTHVCCFSNSDFTSNDLLVCSCSSGGSYCNEQKKKKHSKITTNHPFRILSELHMCNAFNAFFCFHVCVSYVNWVLLTAHFLLSVVYRLLKFILQHTPWHLVTVQIY